MKYFYVSSKLKHRDIWRNSNLPMTSTWIDGEELFDTEDLNLMWQKYIDEVNACDELVLIYKDGETLKGCLIEIGAALAFDKPVNIIYDGNPAYMRESVGTWIYHKNIFWYKDFDEFRKDKL